MRILTAIVITLAAVLSAQADAAPQPNILLILSDDHSAEFVGCYGNPDVRTPNLDRLAAEGLRFDRAYTHPQCVPSRATIMTGRSPVSIGMARFSAPLPREFVTFFEPLRAAAGYAGAIIGRDYHLDGSHNQAPETRTVIEQNGMATFPDRVDFLHRSNRRDTPRLFAEFLDTVRGNRPFVAQIGFDDPHRAFTAPPVHDPATLTLAPDYPDTPEMRADLAQHFDEIARLDADIGLLLAMLEERGLAANTLVIFMGDNGSAVPRGKGSLHERAIRVPLIARWPGVITPGRVHAGLVTGEDLAPTFLAVGGQAPVPGMTGRNLLPLFHGEVAPAREFAVLERGSHSSSLPLNASAFDLARAVVTERFKLIYTATWQLPQVPIDLGHLPLWSRLREQFEAGELPARHAALFARSRPMFELYDLARDPFESTNLAEDPAHAPVAHTLKTLLQEWMIVHRDFLPLPIPPLRSPALAAGFTRYDALLADSLDWAIELYDPRHGGFHENVAMARDPKFAPHLQATGQVLYALQRNGLVATMPETVHAALLGFVRSNRDPETGLHWDRAYPRTIEGRRGDRNLVRVDGFARGILRRLGADPGAAPGAGDIVIPPQLATDEAWQAWMRERLGDRPGYGTLDDLGAHAGLINALPPAERQARIERAVAYVNRYQDPATGLWDDSLDAAFKYVSFLRDTGRPVPRVEAIVASIWRWFEERETVVVDNTCVVCNPVRMLAMVVAMHPELRPPPERLAWLVDWHATHLERFLRSDGGLSRWLDRFPLDVIDTVVGKSPDPQGCVNGHGQALAARTALYQLADRPEPPLAAAAGFWPRFMARHHPETP